MSVIIENYDFKRKKSIIKVMIVILSLLAALLIVFGQALWKSAVTEVTQVHINLLSVEGVTQLLRTPKLYLGVIVYIIATLGYIYLLSKYKYFQVQSLVVGGSLLLTLTLAGLVFHEQISTLNMFGVILIVLGAILVIW